MMKRSKVQELAISNAKLMIVVGKFVLNHLPRLYAWSKLIWFRYKCCWWLEVHLFVSTEAVSKLHYLWRTHIQHLGNEEIYHAYISGRKTLTMKRWQTMCLKISEVLPLFLPPIQSL